MFLFAWLRSLLFSFIDLRDFTATRKSRELQGYLTGANSIGHTENLQMIVSLMCHG